MDFLLARMGPNGRYGPEIDWYLTDQRAMPRKFRITSRAVIPAGGYVVFTEDDWNANPGSTTSFRLDSHGEEIYLFSADANGNLTGYSDGFHFGAAQNGVSFGRAVISTGEAQYPAQAKEIQQLIAELKEIQAVKQD